MEKEIFTDKCSGAAFLEEAAAGFEIKEMKNGKLFYISSSDKYPKGYISDEAASILEAEMSKPNASLRDAVCLLTFANINTDEGEIIPALIKTPQEPKTKWKL